MRWPERALGAAVLAVAVACAGDGLSGDSPAELLIVSGSGQTTPVNQKLPQPLIVEVRGFDTLPLPGVRVDFRVSAGTGALSRTTAVTDAAGRASTELTVTSGGIARVTAWVFSSSLSVSFLASASGSPTPLCQASSARTLVPAQVEAGLSGLGMCLAGGATYVLIASNTDTAVGRSTALRIDVSGTLLPAVDIRPEAQVAHLPSAGLSIARARTTASAEANVTYAPGEVRLLNVNLNDDCALPVMRAARVVAVTAGAVILSDTTNPAGGWSDGELRDFATRFDTLYNPVDTLNFRAPGDMDVNGRVLFLFTRAVNEQPPGAGHSTVLFKRRDLLPRQRSRLLPFTCLTSNESELLYVAVPGVAGRTKADLQAELPRATVHAYQHLINASRRLYATFTTEFEEPWLDEGLSAIAEELLFYAGASSGSRRNLGTFDVALTTETVTSFRDYQRGNIDSYTAFLQAPLGVAPALSADSRAARGAAWSLLRYLADRRGGLDFVTWTQLANSRQSGMRNLLDVFGHRLPDWIRDWSVAVLVDDFFLADEAYRQPSWNFRSLYSGLGFTSFPLNVTGLTSTGVTFTLPSTGAAYHSFRVPSGSVAGVTWASSSGGPPPPLVQWSLIRIQ